MLSLMEGFRRAYELPSGEWAYWQRVVRAFLLVAIVLIPLWLASLLLVFGQQIEGWMINNSDHELRHIVLFFWRMVRWALAFATSVTVLAALYHFGTKRGEHWKWVIPGALGATAVWFPATLLFGWYVTGVADYSMFYGSFAAGIATLVWLYITSFSALLGAELNGVLFRGRQERLVRQCIAVFHRFRHCDRHDESFALHRDGERSALAPQCKMKRSHPYKIHGSPTAFPMWSILNGLR